MKQQTTRITEDSFARCTSLKIDSDTIISREYQTYCLHFFLSVEEKQAARQKLLDKLPRMCTQDSLVEQSFDVWEISILHSFVNKEVMNAELNQLPKDMASINYKGPRATIKLHREFIDMSRNPNEQIWYLIEYLCLVGAIVIPVLYKVWETENGVMKEPVTKRYSIDRSACSTCEGFFDRVLEEIKLCYFEVAYDSANRFEYNTDVRGMHWFNDSTCYSDDYKACLQRSFVSFYDKNLQLRAVKGYVRKTALQSRIEFRFSNRTGLKTRQVRPVVNDTTISGAEMISRLTPFIASKLKKLNINKRYFIESFSDNAELVKVFSAEPSTLRAHGVGRFEHVTSVFGKIVKEIMKGCTTGIKKLLFGPGVDTGLKTSIRYRFGISMITEKRNELFKNIAYILSDSAYCQNSEETTHELSILRKLSKISS